jgi:hypothetical protein
MAASKARTQASLSLWSLEEEPATKESFLRATAPHQNMILTRYHLNGAEDSVPFLNDMHVVERLSGSP